MPDSLYIVRPLQAARGHIEFCKCRAGKMYQARCVELSGERLAYTVHASVFGWLDDNPPLPTLSGR